MPESTIPACRDSSVRTLATVEPTKKSSKLFYLLILLVWVAFALVSLSFVIFKNLTIVEDAFNKSCNAYFEHLQDKVRSTDTVLEGFAALFGAIGSTNPEQAKQYAKQILVRYPQVFALEITRSIPKDELQDFIASQRKELSQKFRIKTFSYDADRKWGDVSDKPFYYPIVFMEPMPAGSEEILGLDVETVPFLRNAMLESIRLNENISSHPFRLVEGNLAYVMFHPVRRNTSTELNNKSFSATPFNVELVVDAAKMMEKEALPLNQFRKIVVYHQDFRPDDPKGQILFESGKSSSAAERILFPVFNYKKLVNSKSSPFVVLAEKQLGWKDINEASLVFPIILLGGSLFIVLAFICQHRKIQILKLKNDELLWDQANHDSLTGIANRGNILYRIEQTKSRAIRHSTKFGLIFLDLNGFKNINDTYGHNVGDRLLQTVANLLKTKIRLEDTVARLGGDEFVVLIDSVDSHERLNFAAENIADVIQGQFAIDEHHLTTSVSMGVALFPDDGIEITELFDFADKKMYANKRARPRSGGVLQV